jgi:LacI family transcriptional regulator
VLIDRRVPDVSADVVRCDSEQGAYDLVHYLLELGHRRIAALGGSQDITSATDRIAGYHRALADADLSQDRVYFTSFTVEGGYQAAQQALTARPRPTALFAANNFVAIGAYKALSEMGLSIPHDVSMVAFDDLPPTVGFEPFLTIIEQPAYDMGRRATQRLLERLNSNQEPLDIVLPTRIVVRKSSGPPPVD